MTDSLDGARLPALGRDRAFWATLATVALVKSAVLGLLLGPCWGQLWLAHITKDVASWADFVRSCRAGFMPYVNFSKEYPVGAGLVYWALSPLLDPDRLRYTVAVHGAVMSALDLLSAALFYALARPLAPRRAGLLTLLFALNPTALVLSPVRFESVVVLLALLGYAAYVHRQPRGAALAWAVGATLKWYPAFFLAAQEWRALRVEGRRWQWLSSSVVFALATAAINLPFALRDWQVHGDLDLWTFPYYFHLHRPLYWDTVIGVLQMWLGRQPWERFASAWSAALMLVAVAVRPRLRLAHTAVLVCVAALLLNRVYSTQFHLWFYPFLLLGAAGEPPRAFRATLGLFVVLDLLNVAVYPATFSLAYAEMGGFWTYSARLHGGLGTVLFSGAILLRAVLLLVLAALLLTRPDGDERLPA